MDTFAAINRNENATEPGAEGTSYELGLLRHLALIGELCERREHLLAELASIEQILSRERLRKAELVQQILSLGGQLPSWPISQETP